MRSTVSTAASVIVQHDALMISINVIFCLLLDNLPLHCLQRCVLMCVNSWCRSVCVCLCCRELQSITRRGCYPGAWEASTSHPPSSRFFNGEEPPSQNKYLPSLWRSQRRKMSTGRCTSSQNVKLIHPGKLVTSGGTGSSVLISRCESKLQKIQNVHKQAGRICV